MSDTDYQPPLFPTGNREALAEGARVVWVFGRDTAELRVAHIEDERLLIVARPDAPTMQRRFASVEALVDFQTELEARLRREGWALKHVEPDRRRQSDRRHRARASADRRESNRRGA